MGCGASAPSAESDSHQVQPYDLQQMEPVGDVVSAEKNDGDLPPPTIHETAATEHTIFGRCHCGRVHKRDYLASRFGNPYLASSKASGEDFTFSHCPLPRLSQPAIQLAPLTIKATLADGKILPPPNRSIAGSASANWLDLPGRWQQQQQLLALPVSDRKTADELRADAVSTWLTKR